MSELAAAVPDALLCPSGRSRAGSQLLGIVGSDGMIIYTPGLPRLTEVQAAGFAASGGSGSYRFAESCVKSDCGNWSAGGCGIARAAIGAELPETADLPRCGIRAQCQWFRQEGAAACRRCPSIRRRDPGIADGT
jgi:hypothetical protein